MKILVIPDIHGKDSWKNVVNLELFDKIVFLGDYFDSHTISWKVCRENFVDILYFKKNNPDKVILLAGNHDNHYIYYHHPVQKLVRCSGFNASAAWGNKQLLNENLRFIQAAWEHNGILFTHAGLTETHYRTDILPMWDTNIPFADFLTLLWRQAHPRILKIGYARGGSDNCPSIFWSDKQELIDDPAKNFIQVVGHTPVSKIEVHKVLENDKLINKLTFTDCIEYREQEYLVINA